MTTTRKNARDEMIGLIRTAWLADPLSDDLVLLYSDVNDEPPAAPAAGTSSPPSWARVTVTHGPRGQGSLADHEGKRRYTAVGLIIIQVFTPSGNGLSISDDLCKILEDALDGAVTPSGVWFRNVRSSEIGKSGPWFQTNVVAEFEYDEIK